MAYHLYVAFVFASLGMCLVLYPEMLLWYCFGVTPKQVLDRLKIRWRNKEAWWLLERAYHHLGMEYASWASFQARGFYLPWQHEALNILEDAKEEVL